MDSVHIFGASITEDVPSSIKYRKILQEIVNKKIVNHYAPTDEVLAIGQIKKNLFTVHLDYVVQLEGQLRKYHQKLVRPKNHRFASYAACTELISIIFSNFYLIFDMNPIKEN